MDDSIVFPNEFTNNDESLREKIEYERNQLKIWEATQEDAVIQVNRIKTDLAIYYGQYMDAMEINPNEEQIYNFE